MAAAALPRHYTARRQPRKPGEKWADAGIVGNRAKLPIPDCCGAEIMRTSVRRSPLSGRFEPEPANAASETST